MGADDFWRDRAIWRQLINRHTSTNNLEKMGLSVKNYGNNGFM